MRKEEKLLFQVLRGTTDANIAFKDLCHLLLCLGFDGRDGSAGENVFIEKGTNLLSYLLGVFSYFVSTFLRKCPYY